MRRAARRGGGERKRRPEPTRLQGQPCGCCMGGGGQGTARPAKLAAAVAVKQRHGQRASRQQEQPPSARVGGEQGAGGRGAEADRDLSVFSGNTVKSSPDCETSGSARGVAPKSTARKSSEYFWVAGSDTVLLPDTAKSSSTVCARDRLLASACSLPCRPPALGPQPGGSRGPAQPCTRCRRGRAGVWGGRAPC